MDFSYSYVIHYPIANNFIQVKIDDKNAVTNILLLLLFLLLLYRNV